MRYEDEFFAEMHPQIAQVIGVAVMQLLVEKQEPSREALIEMIQVLWQECKYPCKTNHSLLEIFRHTV